MVKYTLHNYFRSTTSARVRIALAIKGIDYNYKGYALLPGEHKPKAYLNLNPQGLVPSLEIDGKTIITQSMAILEYLDEVHPSPPLLPTSALGRARVRSLCQIISTDIHPINNLRILQYLENNFEASADDKKAWYLNWAHAGFEALETRLANEPETGKFCHGNTPTMADICLYAQMFNNTRFGMDMRAYSTIIRIHKHCENLEAFIAGAPLNQPDAK
ncbi:MAG: maleylacetoacetate isomerase [Robiginitomaculum sp.]|nr:maleylacetoacetate isomerase [Robiginitomaculum sp.]